MLPGRRFSYRPFLGAEWGTPARLKSSASTSSGFFFFFFAAAVFDDEDESAPDLRFLDEEDEVEGPAWAFASVEGATEAVTEDEVELEA